MKTVDLTSQARPEIELTLSGQTWLIRRVVMATYQLYQQLLSGGADAQKKISDLQAQITSGDAGEDDVLAMQTEMISESERRQSLTYQCIQTIIEANGGEFDQAWWRPTATATSSTHLLRRLSTRICRASVEVKKKRTVELGAGGSRCPEGLRRDSCGVLV